MCLSYEKRRNKLKVRKLNEILLSYIIHEVVFCCWVFFKILRTTSNNILRCLASEVEF